MTTRPSLTLVHGWGIGSGVWSSLRPELARHFAVEVLDLPGFGGSRALSPPDLGGHVAWLRDRLPAGGHALGWSLGGNLLCEFALRHGGHLASVVTLGANPSFVARDDWPGMAPVQLREFERELQRDPVATLQRFVALVALGGSRSRQVARDLRAIVAVQPPPEAAALAAGLGLLAAIDYRTRLAQIAAPALHLFAAADALVPAAVARRVPLAQVLPGGHAPMLAAPQSLLDQLSVFYRRLGIVP